MLRLIDWTLKYASGEFFLTERKLPNGGNVIFIRSILSSLLVFLVLLGSINLIDPKLSWNFSSSALRTQIIEKMPWYGVILGSIYAALYARFASQWLYLSQLYNQIKAAQCIKDRDEEKIAEWKAGFIEDADELHLSRKPLFASVIVEWSKDKRVIDAFSNWACGGGHGRWKLIIEEAKNTCDRQNQNWRQRLLTSSGLACDHRAENSKTVNDHI